MDNIVSAISDASPDDLKRIAESLSDADVKELERFNEAAKRRELFLRAKDNLLDFAHVMMPNPDYPNDISKSRYAPAAHHRLIAEALMKAEQGSISRLIVTMPPRHGKSELTTRLFPMWVIGRDPTREIILGGYSQSFAERAFGKKIQNAMQSARYKQVFPDVSLDGGSKAVDNLQTSEDGHIMSVGRGGSATGFGAHFFIIDDPIKNEKEADSDTILDDVWEWFLTTVDTRLYSNGAIVIVLTRWSEDDIVGRLTNPENPHYVAELAKDWTILHLPAIFEPEDERVAKALGKKVGDPLWPEKTPGGMGGYDLKFLRRKQLQSERTFSALYQGRPSPLEGDLYKADWLIEYGSDQEPDRSSLNFYDASDHATTTKNRSDPSVIGCAGVDKNGVIWVMPDLLWDRIQTDQTVEEITRRIKDYNPYTWFLESENISKAFGPFLRKSLQDKKLFQTVIQPMPVSQDKVKRSQSARGITANGRIRFPKHAPWWPRAKKQLLTFPNAANDDFVDWLSLIGQGLLHMIPGESAGDEKVPDEKVPFTLAWVKAQTKRQEYEDNRRRMRARRY